MAQVERESCRDGLVASSELKRPAGQTEQACDAGEAEKDPAGQVRHVDEAAPEYSPAKQSVQAEAALPVCLLVSFFPARQPVHSVDPAAEKLPNAQVAQRADVESLLY